MARFGLTAVEHVNELLSDIDVLRSSGRHVRAYTLTVLAAEEVARGPYCAFVDA